MATVLTYFLLVVEVVCSFLLIGAILIQKTKSQGIGLAFGVGVGETLFGARAGNFLTKATVVLAIIFLVNTTVLALLGGGRREGSVADKIPSTTPVSQPRPEFPSGTETPQPTPEAPLPSAGAGADASGQMPEPIVVGEPAPAPLPAAPPVEAEEKDQAPGE